MTPRKNRETKMLNECMPQKKALAEASALYFAYVRKKNIFLLASACLIIALTFISITLGYAQITVQEIYNAIFYPNPANILHTIILNVRLPRVLLAIISGAVLAAAGAVMQCILRNPLASPYTMGISQSAAFGAAFGIIVLNGGHLQGFSNSPIIVNNPYIVTTSAFLWSLISVIAILALAKLTRITPEAMILAGVAISAIFTAAITVLQYIADTIQLSSIVYWTFGDLGRANWAHLFLLLAVSVPVLLYFIWNRWHYNALDAGDETAKALGVNIESIRIFGLLTSSLVTSVVVSFVGVIGFIGLLGPHIVKKFIGIDNRHMLPGSLLLGALILLSSDTLARTMFSPMVLPVGVLTSFMGGPLFLYILAMRYKKR